MLGLRMLGAGPRESRVAWTSRSPRRSCRGAGLSTPDFVTLPQALFRELGARQVLEVIVDRLGLPLVVKPSRGGSALGVTLVTSADDLPAGDGRLLRLRRHGARRDRTSSGPRSPVSVVDPATVRVALPAVEIVTDGPYDYDARYNAGRTEFFAPARLSDEIVAARVIGTALAAHRALGLRDLSRTDLIVDAAGTVWFLEVNVAPGMTETSLLPQAVEAAGLALGALYRSMVDAALAR